jgi:predicted phosphodiesterase
MINAWMLSRRKFLGISGTTVAGILISPDIFAGSGNKPVIRFGMLSDVHYADREPAGERFYSQSLGKVQECIDRMNQEKLDFAIEMGDFKDQEAVPNEVNTLKYLTTIESAFQKFDGPTYHVLGNHDMDSISKLQFLERVKNTGISASKSFYSFNQNGFHFVVLDGNFTSEGKEYNHGNFSWDDAIISGSQVNWLKDDLKSNKLPVIVFIHRMLDDSKNVKQAVQNAGEVRQILEQSGRVLCVFQGHVHEERHNLINGIHYCSVNAVVDGDGPDNNAYMVVDIYKDGSMKIDGYRRASDREMKK